MDESQLRKAEKHVRHAVSTGILATAVTFALSIIGEYSEAFGLKYGFDAWNLLDAALLAVLTFGTHKRSRFCATALFLAILLPQITVLTQEGRLLGGIVRLLFVYFLLRGMIATFQIHKHLVETGQRIQKKKTTLFYVGIGVFGSIAIVIVYFIALGVSGPETEVLPGKMMNKKYVDFVREHGLLQDGEEIIYWYSDGYSDFRSGFYFFTVNQVVVYCEDWEDPAIIMPFEVISDIQFEQNLSFFEDSRITLTLDDGSEVFFPVSSENGGDKKFHSAMLSKWESKRLNRPDENE